MQWNFRDLLNFFGPTEPVKLPSIDKDPFKRVGDALRKAMADFEANRKP